jgi:hypothetical protein
MKKEFFSSLRNLIKNNHHRKETDVIRDVYEYAFIYLHAHSQYDVLEYGAKIECRDEETAKCSSRLLNVIADGKPFDDILAEFIESENLTNTDLAQYFTSSDVAELVTAFGVMDYHNKIESREKFQYYSLSDQFGCGAGSLTLAFLRQVDAKSTDVRDFQNFEIWLNDIDENLARIATLAIYLSGIVHSRHIGIIYTECKNSLSEYNDKKIISKFIANLYRYTRVQMLNVFN